MKTNRVALFVCLFAGSFVLTVQAQTNSPARRPEGGFGGGIMQFQDRAIVSVMTEEQRNSYRQALEGQRAALRDIDTKMSEARKELLAASASAVFNESTVRLKAAALAKWEAEMAVIRARALSQVKPPLSSNQVSQMNTFNPGSDGGNRPRPAGGATGSGPRIRQGQRDENDLPK